MRIQTTLTVYGSTEEELLEAALAQFRALKGNSEAQFPPSTEMQIGINLDPKDESNGASWFGTVTVVERISD